MAQASLKVSPSSADMSVSSASSVTRNKSAQGGPQGQEQRQGQGSQPGSSQPSRQSGSGAADASAGISLLRRQLQTEVARIRCVYGSYRMGQHRDMNNKDMQHSQNCDAADTKLTRLSDCTHSYAHRKVQ